MIDTNSICFLMVLILSGCHSPGNTGSSSVMKESGSLPQPVLIRISCQPVVEIKKNDTLVVEFTEYPGRAFSWELAAPDTTLLNVKLVKTDRHSLSNKADPEARAEFFFLGLKTGEERLVFRYFRPWEKAKPAADSCVIKVIVN